ncbi:DUF1479-domain-containing protein [Aulographum hederae CBS 113979]|uniref:DUF1479-domain-containing protein n=1 Tax=Aulographum hederae CBS 113979 TaxID=1176131 RepID=A0A6G1H6A0_9PEZI|nr:DUF1479-domain-containing protein [Aulographum hederae CBS 113979]
MLSHLRLSRPVLFSTIKAPVTWPQARARTIATTPSAQHQQQQQQKRAGDISDAFVSLSGQTFAPLDPRYADLKRRLLSTTTKAILQASWNRLLTHLREETALISAAGSSIVPTIPFTALSSPSSSFLEAHKQRGVAIIKNVVPTTTALQWKQDLKSYIAANPHTKAFPAHDPQVYELYWAPSQMAARTHPNVLAAQRFLMSFWHASPDAAVSMQHPTSYADRLRIRQRGDAAFALGPHVDGGSVERWEEEGYGRGGVYDAVFRGEWEGLDMWDAAGRLPVVSDMYQGVGACSMFRMAQGWLSLSSVGPGEGTLLVNPLFKAATAYYLLRPFFEARSAVEVVGREAFLDKANWRCEERVSSWMQGATPGHGMELSEVLHPHLRLEETMVHIPRVEPGDYVAWHCDTIHAVDKVHQGKGDSSVLYIPACPLTEENARYLARQRAAFVDGTPGPDFGGGEGESRHIGKPSVEDVAEMTSREGDAEGDGLKAFGLKEWDSTADGLSRGEREVMDRANSVLGFYA